MELEPQPNSLSARFAGYIAEVQATLASQGVPFGSPSDIPVLANQLASGSAFADEVSAKMRSIIFREQAGTTQSELLALLVAALGGPEADLRSSEMRTPLRQLLAFLGGALRTFWQSSPEGPLRLRTAGDAPQPSGPALSAQVPVWEDPSPERVLGESPSAYLKRMPESPESSLGQSVTKAEPHAPSSRLSDMNSAAEFMPTPVSLSETYRGGGEQEANTPDVRLGGRAEDFTTEEPRFEAPLHSSPQTAESVIQPPGAEEGSGFPEYGSSNLFSAAHLFSTARRTYWVTGISGVFAGVLIGFLLRGRVGSEVAPAAPGTSHAAITAQYTKAGPSSTPSVPALPGSPSRTAPIAQPGFGRGAAPHSLDNGSEDHGSEPAIRGAVVRPSVPANSRNAIHSPSDLPDPETEKASSAPEHASSDGDNFAERSSVSATEGIYLSTSGTMAANLVSSPAPVYPVAASESGVQGRVIVQALVGRDGHVVEAQVISGDPLLREAALHAVRGWRYRPYVAEGKAKEIETLATLDFRLFQR